MWSIVEKYLKAKKETEIPEKSLTQGLLLLWKTIIVIFLFLAGF